MSETRRQLFKVSIFSAFGLTACSSALIKGSEVGRGASDPQSIGIMIYTTSKKWLYLDPQLFSSYYKAYTFTPCGNDLSDFDLATVAGRLTNHDLTGKMTVIIAGTNPPIYLNIAADSTVTLPPKLTQLTWNEVGSKQHHS